MSSFYDKRKTCVLFATISEVGFLVQNPPTLISLTSLIGPM